MNAFFQMVRPFATFSNAMFTGAILSVLVLLSPHEAGAAEDPAVDKLVENIISIRGEVEDLESQLKTLKDEHATRMSVLSREEGQLTAERERQDLRLKKIQQQLAKQQEKSGTTLGDEELKPAVLSSIATVRAYVETSLPFKREDRLAAIDEMKTQLETGVLEPSRVANQLWAFVADENRLSGEVGLYRQPIRIADENKLVDVARVGMMHLYFRTDDDQVGFWVPGQEYGRFQYVEGSKRDRILDLMASLRKNVRLGYFELPNPSAAEAN